MKTISDNRFKMLIDLPEESFKVDIDTLEECEDGYESQELFLEVEIENEIYIELRGEMTFDGYDTEKSYFDIQKFDVWEDDVNQVTLTQEQLNQIENKLNTY